MGARCRPVYGHVDANITGLLIRISRGEQGSFRIGEVVFAAGWLLSKAQKGHKRRPRIGSDGQTARAR